MAFFSVLIIFHDSRSRFFSSSENTNHSILTEETMQLNVQTGKLSYQEGESVIISDALPFPRMAFYANNYPTFMRIAVITVLLLFSFLAYVLLKRRKN